MKGKKMAYPLSTKSLRQWFEQMESQMSQLKTQAQAQHASALAGTLKMDAILAFYNLLKASHVFFTQVVAVPGIGAYIKSQKQDAVADPVAEALSVQAAVVNAIGWLNTNTPESVFSGQVYKLAYRFPADNTTPASLLAFTAAQTSVYRTQLTALIATIA